ncbi:MAG: VOC family protein [Chloroflexota bacterium]|nr:VOC family protein [Chloroflexota bacterium]
MTQPRLDVIGIIVRDMPSALAFYRQLGLDLPAEMDAQGHVDAFLPGGMRLSFDTHAVIRSFRPDFQPAEGHLHKMNLAFLCASPADVDALYARLTEQGAEPGKAPFDAFWGQRYAQVHDPDGNVIDLFAAL